MKSLLPKKINLTNDKKNKICVLIISSLGPKPYVGGIENVIETLLNSKLKNKFNFFIFDTYRKPDPSRKFLKKLIFASLLPFYCALSIKKNQPEIIHIHFCSKTDFIKHSICLFTSKLFSKSTVFHLHGGTFDTFYNHTNSFYKFFIRFVLKQPDALIALSKYWKSFLVSLSGKNNIYILPNPVDCAALNKNTIDSNQTLRRSVVLLGSLGKRKGHYDVLKAAPLVFIENPDVQFFFAGQEEDIGCLKALESIAKKEGISCNVHFLGPVSGEPKKQLIKNAGVIILPSHGENMPISVLEGMAAGKPVIASRVGAIPEVIIDGACGLLIDAGDWKSLADNLNLCFKNPELANKLGKEAQARVLENWDVDKVVEKIEYIYRKVF